MIVCAHCGFRIDFLRLHWAVRSAYRAAQIKLMDLEIADGP